MALSPELESLLKGVLETQEQIGQTLLKMNEAPNVATPMQGIEDQATPAPQTRRYITHEERATMATALRGMSTPQIADLVTRQAAVKDAGVPLDIWLNHAGFSAQNAFNQLGSQLDPDIAKALDTGGATALIRQDLEPMLYEVFIRLFPAYDRFGKEPANGLLHAWNQITAYGDAKFMAELGTVTDDTSTYERKSTNVAILATRRGISLKSKFAVMAGGMNYNPEAIELQGGLRAMSHKMQKQIFGGNATTASGTGDDEYGLYDANAFTGLRQLLITNAVNMDPSTFVAETTTTYADGAFRNAIDKALLPITQAGGMPSIIWGHPQEKITFDEQQDVNVRLVGPNYVNIGVGVTAQSVNTYAGQIPFATVPGDSIASYHIGPTLYRDLYVLDEAGITLPYLGSPGPTVLEIPIGISGQLTHLYIVFMMNGLAVKVLPWSNKVRVKVAA
jgi:hypothetical protein